MIRLGVNIDHIATLRNARGAPSYPDLLRAAEIISQSGGDGITVHLREDRRHIRDQDVLDLIAQDKLPINLEMAATHEMVEFACRHRPYAVCLVPEKRQELTTEGGLDVHGQRTRLAPYCQALKKAGIKISLFIDPSEDQVGASHDLNADTVELHTGRFAEDPSAPQEWGRLVAAAQQTSVLGLACHAGHGLTFETAEKIRLLPFLREVNIGHFIICESVFIGLGSCVRQMKAILNPEHV